MVPLIVLACAGLGLVLPGSGIAKPPKPDNALIKVPKKLGGVTLGMKLKDADRRWGKRGDCDLHGPLQACVYAGRRPDVGGAVLEARNSRGKVTNASIFAGVKPSGKFSFKGPLMKFATKEGIGLGSKASKLTKKYKQAQELEGGDGYYVPGRGDSRMTFLLGDGKHITTISLPGL